MPPLRAASSGARVPRLLAFNRPAVLATRSSVGSQVVPFTASSAAFAIVSLFKPPVWRTTLGPAASFTLCSIVAFVTFPKNLSTQHCKRTLWHPKVSVNRYCL
jgi:hypothetical protein